MAKLAYVWFWPNGGHRAGLWGAPASASAAVDAFARTSRRVTERYSEALASFGIEARRSMLQMHVREVADDTADVAVTITLVPGGDDLVCADVPCSVSELSEQERARLVLEVVDAGMQRLAQERGWPLDQLEQARQHALDHHLDFEMTGPWKQNRSRTRRARLIARLTDDGWSDLCFEVADAKTGESLGFTRAIKSPANSLPKFKRGVNEMRWAGDMTIERPDDWQVRWGSSWGPVDSFDISDLRAWPLTHDPVPERTPLTVTASIERLQQPLEPEIRFVGGGPTNDVPESYLRSLDVLFDQFQSAANDWWAAADRNLLEIQYEITTEGPDQRVDVRRLKDYVSVKLRRRLDSLTSANGSMLAESDVRQVALSVAKRIGLGDPPV